MTLQAFGTETLAKLNDAQRETAWAQIKTKLEALSS